MTYTLNSGIRIKELIPTKNASSRLFKVVNKNAELHFRTWEGEFQYHIRAGVREEYLTKYKEVNAYSKVEDVNLGKLVDFIYKPVIGLLFITQ